MTYSAICSFDLVSIDNWSTLCSINSAYIYFRTSPDLFGYGLQSGMLTRPEPHEAEATTHEAEATTHEAEATTHKAEAKAEATTHEADAIFVKK